MVDVVDLLDDDTDDEVTDQTKACAIAVTRPVRNEMTNNDSDDEVVWIPSPIAATSGSQTNRERTTEAARFPTLQKTKSVNTYKHNDNMKKDNSDSDVEVLVVDPPPARTKPSPTHSASKTTFKRFPLLDSDSDDDDDDLFLPSSLSKRNRTPIKSWRKQFRTNTEQTKAKNPSDSVDVVTNTPGSAQSHRNSSSGKKILHNPYSKTPQSISNSSVSKTSVEKLSERFRSPVPAKFGSIKKNPYSNNSAKMGSKHNSVNSSAEGAVAIRAPKLRDTTKTYPDIRPNMVLALWKFARRNLVRDSYQGIRLDQFIGRIIDLVVAAPDFPIRSVGEYAIRKRGHMSKRGCGGFTGNLKNFEEDLNSTGIMSTGLDHYPGKYFSISEACLVAMKEMIVLRWKDNQSRAGRSHSSLSAFPADEVSQDALLSQKDYFISLADLIPQIDRRLHPQCPSKLERRGEADKGVSYYLNKATRSAEFKQIEKLMAPVEIPKPDGSIETTSYLKKRLIRGRQHYQLLPLGFRKAVVISKRCLPAPPGPYRFCNIHTVLPKYSGICLAVDFREGGAGDRYRKVLHEMCNKLDLQKIPYFVNTLRIGDYCFFSGDKLCPIIVERKSVEDVAKSIDSKDGRWIKQKARMYHGQYVFGYQNCRMAYIIEGNIEKHLVSNNYIGNARHKVSKERFEEEIANLEFEGFEVLRTCSVENSMFELSRWAETVAKDIKSGRLKLEYSYNEFLEEVDKIPKSVDFSRLAKYHAKERKKSAVDLMSDDEPSGGYERKLSPIVLDERLQKAEKRKVVKSSNDSGLYDVEFRKRFKSDECKKIEARRKTHGSTSSPATISAINPNDEGGNEYAKWTATALRAKCVEFGMKKTGSKAELIERLMDPTSRPPPVYRLRRQRGLYVPANLDTSSTAILVAIQIVQDSAAIGAERYGGATKDEIYVLADKIDIKKDPFCGGTTQTGPYLYDGWSSMKFLKQSGDPPLVVEKKRRFRLSMTGDVCGIKLAREMHVWCHKKGICKCIEAGYRYDPQTWKY